MRRQPLLAALGVAAVVLYLIAASVYIVNEGEQALVVRLGAPVGVVDGPASNSRRRSSTASTSHPPVRSCSSRR